MYSILHVETSNFYRVLIKNICTEIEIEYHSATTIDDALVLLAENPVNLIITAMELEDANSDKLIRRINESPYKNIPIVVITGNDSDEDRRRMFDLGIVDYIIKKAGPDEIKYNLQAYKRQDDVLTRMKDLAIAVCDDSSMDRYIMERIFTMAGIKGVDYYDSGEALLNSGKQYDIYLIDMVLRNLSGSHVVMKLRESGSESVIITISGIDHFKTISNVLNIGANDYITKPFNNELFFARLKTNVRNYLLLNEVRQKTVQLETMAITDGLTGLYNRRHIIDRLEKEIRKAERTGKPVSVLLLDIDFFKKINDTWGHQAGDQVLVKVSRVIEKTVREIDLAGRYGGEEFLVVLPETGLEHAWSVAERIRLNVSDIRSNRNDFKVTISGGIQQWKGQSLHSLVKEADFLLYNAKRSGRNRIEKNESLTIASS